MAVFNKKTNLYEETKFIKLFSALIIGTGETKEEAKKDLKEKIEAFEKNPIAPTGNHVSSPGYERFIDKETNSVRIRFNPRRKVPTFARPDLAEHIKALKDKEISEKIQQTIEETKKD